MRVTAPRWLPQASYNKAKFWVSELQQHGGEGVTIVLVGNKGDLEEKRAVPKVGSTWLGPAR